METRTNSQSATPNHVLWFLEVFIHEVRSTQTVVQSSLEFMRAMSAMHADTAQGSAERTLDATGLDEPSPQ